MGQRTNSAFYLSCWEVQKSLEAAFKPHLTTSYFRRKMHSNKPPSPDGCMVVPYLNVIKSERF